MALFTVVKHGRSRPIEIEDLMVQRTTGSRMLQARRRDRAVRKRGAAPIHPSIGHPIFVLPLAELVQNRNDTAGHQGSNGSGSGFEPLLRAVRSLAHALEAKDAYTWGHSRRVGAYSVAIARELGMSDKEQAMLALGGELHDVGKIGVREDILHKPERLTAEEYDHVMQHTIIGARILDPLLPGDSPVLDIVRWHHERVDAVQLANHLGTSTLSIEAKIVAVADAFDAMTSERPYRRALSVFRALGELQMNAGSQFDADCVWACVSAVTNGRLPVYTF
jgi:HD-GYP domain-containing protein (c-di-GMP phosphodiesterase class II)